MGKRDFKFSGVPGAPLNLKWAYFLAVLAVGSFFGS